MFIYIAVKLSQGSFISYVDKIKWVAGQKMSIVVHVQDTKCPSGGR